MELRNKKILVTGGSGFLGRHIVSRFIERGVVKENISVPRSSDTDLTKRENCERVVAGVDLVIHAAGVSGDTQFHKAHPAEVFYKNIMMGVELIDAARKAGVAKFVTIGSAFEYPDNAPLPYREEDIWIGPSEPLHAPYTTAKRMMLAQGQAYRAQYGMDVVHLLPTNMYGPGESDIFVIAALIKKIGEAKKNGDASITMFGTGDPTRDFLYVDDAAEAVALAVEKYDKPEPANLASGREITMRDLIDIVSKIMQFDGKITWDTTKPDGQLRRVLDPARAEREFGFRAATDLETGLRKTIAYHGYAAN